jgi:hypothetical protein
MKKYYLFLTFCVFQSILFAQNKSIHQIGFTTGLAYRAIKAEAYSSGILSGAGVPVGLFYQRINERSRHTIDVSALSTTPNEKFNTSAKGFSGRLSYDYLKSAYNWQNIRFYYGFSTLLNGGYRKYTTRNVPNNNSAAEGNLTLDAAIMAEYEQDGNRLTGQINYSLLGGQYATLYAFAFIDTRLLTPLNLTQINGSLRYLAPVTKHFNFRTSYLFYLYHSSTPQYLGVLEHQLELAICYKW